MTLFFPLLSSLSFPFLIIFSPHHLFRQTSNCQLSNVNKCQMSKIDNENHRTWQPKAKLTDSRDTVNDIKFAPRHMGLRLVIYYIQLLINRSINEIEKKHITLNKHKHITNPKDKKHVKKQTQKIANTNTKKQIGNSISGWICSSL